MLAVLALLAVFGAGAFAQTFPNLEGQPAPRIEGGIRVGPGLPGANQMKGKPTLVFFWAHWCSECKAQAPILSDVVSKYGPKGLVVIAPTRLYGIFSDGRRALPDKELLHIVSVRDSFYPFLRRLPVPVGETNHKKFGIEEVPTLVVIDPNGIIRLNHAGRITAEALDAALDPLF